LADGTHERLVVANHRQADGLQAALGGIKDLAASQRRKSQLPKVIAGVRFENAIGVIQVPATTPPDRLVT
jgi:hypothetical protein